MGATRPPFVFMEFYSHKRYTGDGTTTDFTIPFDYLEKRHVSIRINGVEMSGPSYEWVSDYTVRFGTAPAEGAYVDFRRVTPKDAREVVYVDGSTLNADQLNTLSKQLLFISQEIHDDLRGALGGENPGNLEGYVPDDSTQNDIVAEIAAKLTESTLYNEFQTQVEDFEQTATTVLNNQDLMHSVQSDVQALDSLSEEMGEITIEGFLRESDRWEQSRAQDSRLVDHKTRIETLEAEVGTGDGDGSLSSRVTEVEEVQASQGDTLDTHAARLTTVESEIDLDGDGSADVASHVQSLEATQTSQGDTLDTHATRLDSIESEIDLDGDGTADVASRIQTIETTQSTQGDEIDTVASRADTIESELDLDGDGNMDAASKIETLETTQSTQGDTLSTHASRLDTVESELDTDDDGEMDAKATIGSIQTTQASQDDTLSSHANRLTQTEAELDTDDDGEMDAKASIQENATAVASHDDEITELYGKYTVKVDVDGRVAGFGLAQYENDDTGNLVSDFYVTADRFAVIDPDTDETKVGWDGSQFTVDGNLIVGGSFTADQMNIQQLSSITADLGTVDAGLIRSSDSGDRVEMEAGHQFPFWYGSGDKTSANGKFYLDDSGVAFFGGSVSVGEGAGGGTGLDIQDDKIVVRDGNGAVRVRLGKLD